MTDPGRDVADTLALQQLIASYARGVDARDYETLGDLFTEEGRLSTRVGAEPDPRYALEGRHRVQRAMATIEQYQATTHLLGLPWIELDGDRARCETHCLAHHLYEREGEPRLFVMSIRYQDRCVRETDRWRFAERRLQVDWEEDRPFHPPEAALESLQTTKREPSRIE